MQLKDQAQCDPLDTSLLSDKQTFIPDEQLASSVAAFHSPDEEAFMSPSPSVPTLSDTKETLNLVPLAISSSQTQESPSSSVLPSSSPQESSTPSPPPSPPRDYENEHVAIDFKQEQVYVMLDEVVSKPSLKRSRSNDDSVGLSFGVFSYVFDRLLGNAVL